MYNSPDIPLKFTKSIIPCRKYAMSCFPALQDAEAREAQAWTRGIMRGLTHDVRLAGRLLAKDQRLRGTHVRIAQLAIGLTAGLAGALGVGQLLQAFLRETRPRDPLTLGVVAAVLVIVAAAATLLPARRAARVNPTVALRTE